MKVSVKKKDAPKVLTIQTDFIKLEAALKYAALTATGGEAKEGAGHRQWGGMHHAWEEAPQRRQLHLPGRDLCDFRK